MNNERAIERLDRLESDSSIQNLIAQSDSKYILFNVKEPEENFPNYTIGLDEKLTSIAFSYLSIGCSLAENEKFAEAIYPLEKGATILENIYSPEANRNEFSSYFILASSLAYYAANQYSKSFILLKTVQFDTVIAKLISFFLRRKYNELDIFLSEVFLSKKYTELNKSEEEGIANNKIYITILSKSMSCLLEFMLTGEDEWLGKAKESILDLLELVAIDNEPSLWWVVRLFNIIADGFYKNSLWRIIPPNIGSNDIVKNYIALMVFQANPVVELFHSQKQALPKVLEQNGAVVSLPTSSGKTRVAELAILDLLSKEPESKVLYLAPFRSLAFEIEELLSKIFEPNGFGVSQLYDGPQFTKLDELIIQDTSIIIATPEKAKALIRSKTELKSSVKLIIIDEGHLLGPEKRYVFSEMFIEELRLYLKRNNGKIVLLSAVLPNSDEIANWISGDKENKLNSDWRPSTQRFGLLEYTGNNVNIIWQGNMRSFNRNFVNSFIVKKPRSEYLFPKSKREAIAISAVKLSLSGSVLIFVYRKNMVMTQAESVVEAMKNEEMKHVWSKTTEWNIFKMACEEVYGSQSKILQYAELGVLCHHGGLPREVRISMERLMRTSNPKVIIATSTLGQGVNIGVSTVIIANVWYDAQTTLKANDFWNIVGRAGRSFVDREGKILFATDLSRGPWIAKRDRKLALEYFNDREQESAISGLLYIVKFVHWVSSSSNIGFDILLQLIAENDYSSLKEEHANELIYLFDMIDDTLLALNLEIQTESDITKSLDDIFRNTLAYIQAHHFKTVDSEDVISFLKARNEGVIKLAGDQSNWNNLVSSGIPLRSGLKLIKEVDAIVVVIRSYQSSSKGIDDLVKFLNETELIINNLPSKQFDVTILPDDIRQMWIRGQSLSGESDALKEQCNNYYGFTIPWGINAIAKILYNSGLETEAEEFETLAVLVQMGLPNLLATRIYLAGIQSRVAATELSTILESSAEDFSLNEIRVKLSNIQTSEYSISEETLKWLDVVNNTHAPMTSYLEKIPNFVFTNPVTVNSDTLSAKQYEGEIFLCSPQYDDKIKVSVNEEFPFDKYANDLGVHFIFRDGNWIIESRNPYVKESIFG